MRESAWPSLVRAMARNCSPSAPSTAPADAAARFGRSIAPGGSWQLSTEGLPRRTRARFRHQCSALELRRRAASARNAAIRASRRARSAGYQTISCAGAETSIDTRHSTVARILVSRSTENRAILPADRSRMRAGSMPKRRAAAGGNTPDGSAHGRQPGLVSFAGLFVRFVCLLPFAFMMNTSFCSDATLRTNAILAPSGDHFGPPSLLG